MLKKKLMVPLAASLDLWLKKGIISEEQRKAIAELHSKRLPEKTEAQLRAAKRWLPKIMVSMAVVLLAAGLFLFYASNWRHMPPIAKLVQVFALIAALYGTAFVLAHKLGERQLITRAFLVLGILSFGLGVALVAQIYHISAHPSNYILAWAVAALLAALLCDEPVGLYLSLALTFTWYVFEAFAYNKLNVFFVAALAVYAFIFYKQAKRAGLVAVFAGFLFFFYKSNFYLLTSVLLDDWGNVLFVVLHMPLGLVLVAAGHFAIGQPGINRPDISQARLKPVSLAAIWAGWIMMLVPLLGLSWPLELKEANSGYAPKALWRIAFLKDGASFNGMPELLPIFIEGIVLFTILGVIILQLVKQRKKHEGLPKHWLFSLMGAFAFTQFFVPIDNKAIWLLLGYLAIVSFVALTLYYTHSHDWFFYFEQKLAVIFSALLLFSKGLGFDGGAVYRNEYLYAYVLGFVTYSLLMYLVFQVVARRLAEHGLPFAPLNRLSFFSSISCFFSLYSISFKIKEQQAPFGAEPSLLLLLGAFFLLGTVLLVYLWIKGADKMIALFVGILFVLSAMLLLFAGPERSWIFYSIITNIILLVFSLGLVFLATRYASRKMVALALGFFALHITTRYFDLFWDMFSGSIMLIVSGAIIFLGGFLLERHRHRLFKYFTEAKAQEDAQ